MTWHCKIVFMCWNSHYFIKRTTWSLEFFIRDTLIFHYLTYFMPNSTSMTTFTFSLGRRLRIFHCDASYYLQNLWMMPEIIGGSTHTHTHRCLKLIYCLPREGAWWELLVPVAFKVTKLFRKLILPERFFLYIYSTTLLSLSTRLCIPILHTITQAHSILSHLLHCQIFDESTWRWHSTRSCLYVARQPGVLQASLYAKLHFDAVIQSSVNKTSKTIQ